MIDASARRAWQELATQLRPFVARRVARSTDVDDVLQEVLLRMVRGVDSVRDEARFGPWVYRVARSAIADHQRASARHPVPDRETSEALDEASVSPEPETDDQSVAENLASYMAPFVAMLPSPYREALTLTELQGQTQAAAAEMLGVSLTAMKSRVQRGRERLRELLEACCAIALDARGRVVACEPRSDADLPGFCAPGTGGCGQARRS